MLLDWQDQYCKNVHLAKSSLQIQFNPHQIPNSILHRVRKSNSQIHLEQQQQQQQQNTRTAKTILNKKRTSVGISVPDLKQCYRAIMIKKLYSIGDRKVGQWN